MSSAVRLVVVGLLVACAQAGAPGSSGVGRFVFAGATGGASEELTVRWRYGFQFSIDPRSVAEVKLSCGDIPGSAFTVTQAELGADASGTAFWEGPALPVTKESVPWLFDPGTTSAVCEAVVSRAGMTDAVEHAPVTFTSATKRATLDTLRMANEFNRAHKKK
jgi:hypothetical protein